MFQFSFSVAGPTGTGSSAGSPLQADNEGLSGLLGRLEGAEPAFSGELQALLMQMSPEMLKRLDEMLAGGMGLPQAASRLLESQDPDSMADAFARLLGKKPVATADAVKLPLAEAGGGVGRGAARLLDRLPATLPTLAELLPASHAGSAQSANPLSPGSPVSGFSPLAPQLASSLLDMGVPQPVGSKGWSGAIAERVMWMVQGDQQFARLKLNPPNLGPLEVRVNIQQDQASVSFLASQAAVREALEQALPRLREMLDQQSLQLVRADVSDPGAQQQERGPANSAWPGGGHAVFGDPGDADQPVAEAVSNVAVSTRLVDLFA